MKMLDNLLYTYDPHEFFPVMYEGKLQNKSQFVRYKTKHLIKSVVHTIAESKQ
jgi:hypothetical protein